MEENPMVVDNDMGSAALTDPPSGEGCELDKLGIQKISVAEERNSLKFSVMKSDSFVVDMDRFSHVAAADKDMSRITLQRTVSRKGQGRCIVEKKTNSTATSERDSAISSPRSGGGGVISSIEKSMVVTTVAIEPPLIPHDNLHPHQTTIVTNGNNTASKNSENRLTGRKYSFKRSSPSNWGIDPRRILLFFATLSSMGSILLIYFTLSMGKLGQGGDDAAVQDS